MIEPLWPHRDYALGLSGVPLYEGATISIDSGGSLELLRIIEDLGARQWRVRPTTTARPLNAEYRRRQRARAKRRRS